MSFTNLGSEWHLTPEGLNQITDNGSVKDYKRILKTALDTDLKEIGAPLLKDSLSNLKTQKYVLQIQKVRNVSAPKANESSQAAPRMLKLTLTDGESYIQAIELSNIPSISREKTAPGTKVIINSANIVSGYLLLNGQNCTVLGGNVPHLYEKWELAKSVQQTRQIASTSGAPPWVNFGSKIQVTTQGGSFKSLTAKQKENKDNADFEQQRQEAIAEAASGAVRKTFGGRVKQNVQATVNQPQKRNFENRERKGGRIRTGLRESEPDEKPLKPSDKVSLFAFLEDKLPTAEPKNNEQTKPSYQKQQYHQNHERNYPVLNSTQNSQKPQVNHNFTKTDSKQQSYPERSSNTQYQQKNTYPNKQNNYYGNQQNNISSYQSNTAQSQQRNTGYNNNTLRQQQQPQNNYHQNSYNSYNNQQRHENSYTQNNYNHNSQRHAERNVTERKQEIVNKPPSVQNTDQTDKNVDHLAESVAKISVNNEFASRSLRQHLNLGGLPKRKEELSRKHVETGRITMNVGDVCMAKYWEDGKFYNAIITAVTDRTYAVQFQGYGNIEEVLKTDCFSVTDSNYYQNKDANTRPHSSTMEFRRTPRK